MQTEVMLMADVKFLGKAGEIVKVAPGYARNKLLPQGLAAPVTEAEEEHIDLTERAVFALCFAASEGNNIIIKPRDDRPVSDVTRFKIRDDNLALHTQSEHQEGCSPPRPVFSLRTVPKDSSILRRLNDQTQKRCVLKLRELRADKRRIHVRGHHLYFRIEGVIDYMTVQLQERLIGYGFSRCLLGSHVYSR